MTGTQIGNNPLLAAYGAVLVAIITAFAIYDLYKRRVPNKALAFSAPVFLAAPILAAWDGDLEASGYKVVEGGEDAFCITSDALDGDRDELPL